MVTMTTDAKSGLTGSVKTVPSGKQRWCLLPSLDKGQSFSAARCTKAAQAHRQEKIFPSPCSCECKNQEKGKLFCVCFPWKFSSNQLGFLPNKTWLRPTKQTNLLSQSDRIRTETKKSHGEFCCPFRSSLVERLPVPFVQFRDLRFQRLICCHLSSGKNYGALTDIGVFHKRHHRLQD